MCQWSASHQARGGYFIIVSLSLMSVQTCLHCIQDFEFGLKNDTPLYYSKPKSIYNSNYKISETSHELSRFAPNRTAPIPDINPHAGVREFASHRYQAMAASSSSGMQVRGAGDACGASGGTSYGVYFVPTAYLAADRTAAVAASSSAERQVGGVRGGCSGAFGTNHGVYMRD
ncbi:hypothetical protein PHYSODRAFT_306674 [Phytophthora sojae]|uniref:Uncharacterized protein n=1 Tax=Phytophthora sojae (strain P6497) TaxID=1094619 RepID=G5AA98_PHYSP|nr:hypothetical protein PHYSODRAFT_306674 [Phytophthora sojae]EGZ07527.1 hypothetical protein PHYSODRAFT_306674 [Phytophthora sojae]|eukprot:XP_009537093.1 hypothetical protein PHYSODRAFT_306674 [Phytophthora sojae]